MYVLAFDENQNILMKQVFNFSGKNKTCAGHTANMN